MTRLTRTSIITRRDNTMILPVDSDRVADWIKARRDDPLGAPLVQDAFPDLSEAHREFLLTGVTPAEWNQLYPKGA